MQLKTMQRKTKTTIVLVFFVACLALVATLHVYYVIDGSAATVFSRGDEAYLFLGNGRTGYRVSYLAFPFVILRQYFNAPIEPTDESGCSLDMRITSSNIERYLTHCGDPDLQFVAFLTPFEDGFYAHCRGAILCKWTDRGFVPATQEEARRIGGESALVKGDMNNQIVNGWHVHRAGWPGDHFEVPVGEDLVLSVTNRATNVREWQYPWITVDLLRPGQSPQTLYDVNGYPRRVSKSEYEQTFRGRH
jgi:hypothetical protein